MNRFKWLLIAACLMLMFSAAALAETAPEDGLYTVGVQSSSRMFKVTGCVLQVLDGKMTAVITLSSDGYGYVFAGTAHEANEAPVDTWIPYAEDWDGAYTYAIPISSLDEEIPVAGYSRRYEKWYDRTLVFHSSTLSPHDEIAPDGVYSAIMLSCDDEIDGTECILTSKGGEMTLKTAAGTGMSLASLDRRIFLDNDSWIMVRAGSVTELAVQADDGVYQAEVITDSSLLGFKGCTLKVDDGKMTAVMTAKNNNFDYLYIGSAADAPHDEAGWIPAIPGADGAYTYIMEIPSLDNELQIATYSAKKKMWYDRTLFIDSESLTAEGGK